MSAWEGECSKCIIGPGYVAVSADPAVLCSVCGSGTVVAVWDPVTRKGGMVHCIYPARTRGLSEANYCADTALKGLIREMRAGRPVRLEAQVFGAGSRDGRPGKHARKTLAAVIRILKKEDVPVVSEDTGGSLGRKIMFNTRTGDAVVLKTRRIRLTDWAPEYLVNGKG